jgi:serine/threonine protein phosphatase PrpC
MDRIWRVFGRGSEAVVPTESAEDDNERGARVEGENQTAEVGMIEEPPDGQATSVPDALPAQAVPAPPDASTGAPPGPDSLLEKPHQPNPAAAATPPGTLPEAGSDTPSPGTPPGSGAMPAVGGLPDLDGEAGTAGPVAVAADGDAPTIVPAAPISSSPTADTLPLLAADDETPDSQPEPGTLLAGRFSVLRTLTPPEASEMLGGVPVSPDEGYLAVEDRQDYAHCWACGSTHNDPRQRFCADCGAPRQQEWVLAQSAAPTGLPDEVGEAGAYYHLLHRRKQFGSTGMALEAAAFSAEGPHVPNEDSVWATLISGCFDSKAESTAVLVLADGMGGYASGSGLISKVVVETVGRGMMNQLLAAPETNQEEGDFRMMVRGAIAAANGKVLEEVEQRGDMGATLVAALIYGHVAYVANIGDSRAYYIAPSGAVTQITRDQSLIEHQVAMGLMSPDAVYTAQGNNVILHAVGEPGVEDAFDWYTQPLEPGSYLLLCSDGYWKTMRHDIWHGEALAGQPSLYALARSMVQRALERNTDDNTTVLLVGVN